MADNYEKLWLQDSFNAIAIARAATLIENTGRALPCRVTAVNGSIVKVAFEVNSDPITLPQISIPKAESPWVRMPTQVGDFGVTMPASAYLGGISGLGGGVATLDPPGNLAALVFVPVSNINSPPSNPNAAIVQGPQGAIIKTTTGTSSSVVVDTLGTIITFGTTTFTINNSEVSFTAGGKTVTLNSTGLTIDGILFDTHIHGGVTTGSGVTLGPQA